MRAEIREMVETASRILETDFFRQLYNGKGHRPLDELVGN